MYAQMVYGMDATQDPEPVSSVGTLRLFPAVKINGAVSPMTRPIARSTPVIRPGNAALNVTFHVVDHFVAPSARDASLSDIGTALRAS